MIKTHAPENRIQWVDMAKGYGIILVIFGHLHPKYIVTWIYSFHMPLFFFLSGYCFHVRTPFKDFLKRKISTMIIPYFALGIPIILFAWFEQWYGPLTFNTLKGIIWEYVLQCGRWDVWFLACLFLLNMIYWVIIVKISSTKIQLFLTILLPIIGYTYILLCGGRNPLPWNLDVSLMAAPFFYSGYKYRINESKIIMHFNTCRKQLVLFLGFFVVSILCCFLSKIISGENVNMFKGTYGLPFLTLLSAFAGIICMVFFSMWRYIRSIGYIGENSLLYFAWHEQLCIPICGALLRQVGFPWNESWNNFQKLGYLFLQLLIILLILTIANFVITNTRLCVIVGKQYKTKDKGL